MINGVDLKNVGLQGQKKADLSKNTNAGFDAVLDKALNNELLLQNSDIESINENIRNRPSIKEFMDKTGVSFEKASILYVVKSSQDIRDWKKIMNSDDPYEAAKKATSMLFDKEGTIKGVKAEEIGEVVAKTENLVYIKTDSEKDRKSLYITTKDGTLLTHISGDEKKAKNLIEIFGIEKEQLSQMDEKIAQKGEALPKFGIYAKKYSLSELNDENEIDLSHLKDKALSFDEALEEIAKNFNQNLSKAVAKESYEQFLNIV